jgi:hypothetical protein
LTKPQSPSLCGEHPQFFLSPQAHTGTRSLRVKESCALLEMNRFPFGKMPDPITFAQWFERKLLRFLEISHLGLPK